MKPFLSLLVLLVIFLPGLSHAEPVKEKGISMQMVPQRVARIEGVPWGFYVEYAEYLAPEASQPLLQTPVEFSAYLNKQDPEVQRNGVWILLFNPEAYSEEENLLLEKIRNTARKSDIPIFFRYATEPEDAWQQQ